MPRISQLTRIGALVLLVATTPAITPPDASAQPSGGRRGGGGGGGARARVVVAPPLYNGYGYGFYDQFWGPMWSPFGWYGPSYNSTTYDPNQSSARLQVKPRTAEVYVEGDLAGTRTTSTALFSA